MRLLIYLLPILLSSQVYVNVEIGYPFYEHPTPGARLTTNYGLTYDFDWRETQLGLDVGYYSLQKTGYDLKSVDLLVKYSPFNNFWIKSGVNYSLDYSHKNFEMELMGTIPFKENIWFTATATNVFIKTRNVLSVSAGILIGIDFKKMFERRYK